MRAVFSHIILLTGTAFLLLPVALVVFSSTHDAASLARNGLQLTPGGHFFENYGGVLSMQAGGAGKVTALAMLKNSLIVGFGVAGLTTVFSMLSAYALVYFRLRYAGFLFWLILATLLFPLESRFIPTFEITSDLGLINTHLGLVLPVLAAALGTFFFRQFFLAIPSEYLEAAILDGAGPVRFFIDFIIPLSIARTGAVFVIAFMIGWNQYLWPLMISTDDSLYTLMRGLQLIGQNSPSGFALIVISILPPFVLLLVFQRWFLRGLET